MTEMTSVPSWNPNWAGYCGMNPVPFLPDTNWIATRDFRDWMCLGSDGFPVSEPPSLRWTIYNGYWCLHKEGATEALSNGSLYFIHYLWEVIDSHLLWLPRYSGTICTLRNLEADHLTGLSEWKKHFDEFRWVFVTGSYLPRQSAHSCGEFVWEYDTLWYLQQQ